MNANATEQAVDTVSAEQNIQSWFNRLSPFDDMNNPVSDLAIQDLPAYSEHRIKNAFQA